MKKEIAFIVVTVAIALTSCSSTQKQSESADRHEIQMVGAYTNYRAISADEKELFNSTYNGETKLTPKKVATQVVAGINYSFLCSDSKGAAYLVVIYQPLPGQGKAEVSSVTKK